MPTARTSLLSSIPGIPGQADHRGRLLSIIDTFATRRLLVVGDLIADEFIYGDVARVSREAPVLILKYDTTAVVPGGAGNAASNVAALGGRACLAGIVGADAEGRRLLASLPRGVDRSLVVREPTCQTPIKTRILAGGVHAARQQIVRIDREPGWPVSEKIGKSLIARLRPALADCDGVLLSDYGSGLVSPELAGHVQQALGRRSNSRLVPILIDSRYRLTDYRGLTACTPNESEVEQAIGGAIRDNGRLERAGRWLLKKTGMPAVLVTRGSRGMALFEPRQPTVHVPIFGSDEVTDVTGAGDTVMATFGLALSAGATFYEAARLANYAGGLVVMKRGTATVSARELSDAVRSDRGGSPVDESARGQDR